MKSRISGHEASLPLARPPEPRPLESRLQEPGGLEAGLLDSGLPDARLLARGVCRHLTELGYASLTEFTLRSGRRADVIALEPGGQVIIVE